MPEHEKYLPTLDYAGHPLAAPRNHPTDSLVIRFLTSLLAALVFIPASLAFLYILGLLLSGRSL